VRENHRIRHRLLLVALLAIVAAAAVAKIALARESASLGTGVVTITTRLAYQGGRAAGTGMVITPSGEVLTNNHVIAGATSVRVSVPGTARSYAAIVVGYDVRDDVALLRLLRASNLRTVSTTSANLSLGQRVTAVGNAGGSGALSSASGRITGLGRTITARDDQGGSETLRGLIETNAGVVAGDSGGPLLDANGKVVGMVTAASTTGTFGFPQNTPASDAYAVPVARALRIADAIAAGRSSTAVHVGPTAFLGVQLGSLDNGAAGALIVRVVPGGAADAAGLVAGDVITRVAGRAVTSPGQVAALVRAKKPGARIAIRYLGQAGAHTATVRLGTGPPQ